MKKQSEKAGRARRSGKRVISVNIGPVRHVRYRDRLVPTGIFKYPSPGRHRLGATSLEGDVQADRSVHGGADMAVYVYPSEHYAFWEKEFPGMQLPWGIFGENLTSRGLSEETVRIGDRFRIGSAVVEVTQPRMPCYKLGIRFGRPDIIKRFRDSRRTGFYLRVIKEGRVGAGDPIQPVGRSKDRVTVAEVVRLHLEGPKDLVLLRRAVKAKGLSGAWRGQMKRLLERASG